MKNNLVIHKVRVFVNGKGEFGNPVGIVLDEERSIKKKDRQQIAKNIGFSETVFIDKTKPGI